MAGPRKVRIFRDLKKSPNWYVEWRDAEGRRHCESCGPQRQDAEERASRIKEELRRQREEAKRVAGIASQDAPHDETAPSTATGDYGGSVLRLRGVLRFAQIEVPITISLDVPPDLLTAFKQALEEAGHR